MACFLSIYDIDSTPRFSAVRWQKAQIFFPPPVSHHVWFSYFPISIDISFLNIDWFALESFCGTDPISL